jgi:transcription elongation factor GreA
VIVEESELAAGQVGIGSTVELEDEQGGRIEGEISIVGGTGAISPDSPLGRALIGRREGDAVEVEAPRGTWTARIVSIRRS